MEVVVNKAFGGYQVPQEVADKLGCWKFDGSMEVRTNPTFIQWVKDNEGVTSLRVVYIDMAEVTDYELTDYDGMEGIIYVVDGKLRRV